MMNRILSEIFGLKVKWLVILLLSGVLAISYAGSPTALHASETTHASEEQSGGGHGESGSEGEHGSGGGEEGGHGTEDAHHEPAPTLYYLIWFTTIFIVLVTIVAWLKVRFHEDEHGDGHHGPEFAGPLKIMGSILIAAVFLLFLLEGGLHWHEGNGMGIARVVLKMVTGVSLMFWGIVFMHHEEEEEGGHGDAHGSHH